MPKLISHSAQPMASDLVAGTIAFLWESDSADRVSSAMVRRLTHAQHKFGCQAHTESGHCSGCVAFDEVRARGWFS